jgi:DNA processing protein
LSTLLQPQFISETIIAPCAIATEDVFKTSRIDDMLDTTLADTPLRSATGLIILGAIRGIGRVAALKAVNVFDTFGELVSADDESLKACFNAKQRAAVRDANTVDTAYKHALKETSRAVQLGAYIVSLYDADYPERLKALEEPPFLLYTSGDLSLFDNAVGFVGTREPTPFGEKVAYGMASAFAQDGWCIASGLARGIDGISHRAALDVGGTTCAILPSGLDVYTSGAAMDLAKRICDSGGLIVSECGFGKEANRGSYIDRDRLITGLSLATVFVQGDTHSGSMHSVRYAITQGKPVYVPNIPDRYLGEDINHTARDLARMSLGQFAARLEWTGSVLEAVNRHSDRPAANAIMSRDDYPRVFDEIRELLPHTQKRPHQAFDIAATF